MRARPGCEAAQYSDQMQCARCGLAWDVNDHEPPECAPPPSARPTPPPKPDESAKEYGRRTLSRLLKEIRT